MMGSLGTIVGIWADKWDQQQGITNFIYCLTFLSGTFILYQDYRILAESIFIQPFFYNRWF